MICLAFVIRCSFLRYIMSDVCTANEIHVQIDHVMFM